MRDHKCVDEAVNTKGKQARGTANNVGVEMRSIIAECEGWGCPTEMEKTVVGCGGWVGVISR